MPISHVSLATGKTYFNAMRTFYLASLAPLGYSTYVDMAGYMVGLRQAGKGPDFWLHFGYGNGNTVTDEETEKDMEKEKSLGGTHVAFDAESRKKVDEWYDAAIKAGGICNGKPGIRKEYADTYYAAFVLDPVGNNVEAVHFVPETAE